MTLPPHRLPLVRLLLAFGIICLATAWTMTVLDTSQLRRDRVPSDGGLIGPFKVDQPNTIVRLGVSQHVPLNHWSTVNIALLDKDKKYLTGFGEGFWHEEGIDSEGYYWRESDTDYTSNLTIPKPGEYYLQVSTEDDFDKTGNRSFPIVVEVSVAGYSEVPHVAAGSTALIVALLLMLWRVGRHLRDLAEEN